MSSNNREAHTSREARTSRDGNRGTNHLNGVRVLEAHQNDRVGHERFLRDIRIVRQLLQTHLLRDEITMESLRVNFVLPGIPASEAEQAETREDIHNVEFRENQLCEILDILNQLESTVPVHMIGN